MNYLKSHTNCQNFVKGLMIHGYPSNKIVSLSNETFVRSLEICLEGKNLHSISKSIFLLWEQGHFHHLLFKSFPFLVDIMCLFFNNSLTSIKEIALQNIKDDINLFHLA